MSEIKLSLSIELQGSTMFSKEECLKTTRKVIERKTKSGKVFKKTIYVQTEDLDKMTKGSVRITDKNGKNYIKKIGIFSFFWFASCIALVDFNSFNWELLIQIITSYEFIFLGCLIPDYFSQIERERDNSIKKMEERNSILENNQSHQS